MPGSIAIIERAGLMSGERIGVGVSAEWRAYQPVEADRVRRWLVAEPADKDLSQLQDDQDIKLLEADIWPDWFPTYPFLSNRIAIQYPWQAQ